MVKQRVVFLMTVLTVFSLSSQEDFSHVNRYYREEFGDEVTVRSVGTTRGLVELDDKNVVKRIMCKDMKIKVSLTDVRVARQWRPGDIVLGSSDHGCNIHTVHPEQPGIYAKILTKTEMKNNRVDLIVEQAKPLDIFEEAKISVHVERDAERFHSRHKRSTSSQQSIANFLKIPLESIDWNKTVHTTIPFNSDKKVLALRKMSYQILPEIIVEDRADFVEAVDPEFEFLCSNCLGDTTLGYHMETVIKTDARNEPNVKSFVSQIEGRSSGSYDFSIKSTRELTLSHTAELVETPSIRVDMLPLSKFHRLPPMFLELNISSITSLSVYATARDGNVTVKGDFSTEGNFVVSKEYHSPTSPPTQQATVNNWTTLQGTGNTVLANTTFYYNVNVSQEICIQPYIRWAKKDVHLKFSSPFKIRLDQGIVASSTAAVSAIQNEAMSNITGYFDTSDNRVDIRAFGVQIWDLMLSPGQHQTEAHVTNHSLFSQSMANCFGDPSELDMGSCGDPGTAIIRTSENFDSLKKIFGDELILFTDDENKTCTWCGRKGRQCRSCSEYSVDANEVCADRLMVSAMATAITKLAKFIQAEWANRRLVVLDAWTEPTSLYPEGKYGHSTLHNEGRAASVGISKPLFYFPPNVEIETDREILHRLKDLFRCSGFSSAVGNATDGVYELCVSNVDKSQKYHTKKRRKRKRQANNDMSSHSEKREDLAKKMAALPEYIKCPSTISDRIGSELAFPTNETAESMCGTSDEIFKRENENMKKLFQYPCDNVEFEAEGPSDSWCGTETRQCRQCSHFTDSSDPMEWCGSRIMNARLAFRIYRLTKFVEKYADKPTKQRKDSSITIQKDWTELEFAKCRNGPSYKSLSMETCQSEMKLSKDKCTQCMKERKCCFSGCLQADCNSRGICTEKNPFKDNIPSSPSCDDNDPWKVKLFDNVCTGDPCMFLNGAGIYVLMKILMLFEVCSPIRNETEMEKWMANTSSASSEKPIYDFFKECRINETQYILKVHDVKSDKHIGVGINLDGDNPALMKKALDISNETYSRIYEGKKSITEKQALYLFAIVLRTKLKGLWRVIRYEDLVLLPTNVKIAIFNANYRGDFGQGVADKFKEAVENGTWQSAVNAYLDHPDYKTNYGCLDNETHDICKRYNFNAKQFESMINRTNHQTVTVGNSKSKSDSATCSNPPWFESLRQAGRAAKISLSKGYSLSTKDLANLAVEAGFDFIQLCGDSLYTCVKATCGTTSQIIQYPRINLYCNDPNTSDTDEYQIPPCAEDTLSHPPLIDGAYEDLQLSDCYKIKDFKAHNYRYFRLDPNLLECLDLASEYYGSCIKVLPDSGYRPRSLNNKNIDSRHEEEKCRFGVGRAAEVQPQNNTADNLKEMTLTIMRTCLPGLRLKRLKLVICVHLDRVYIDIRASNHCCSDILKICNVDNSVLFDVVYDAYRQMLKGVSFIQPTNKEKACKTPTLGKDNYYVKSPTQGSCLLDFSDSFCEQTKKHREEKAEELADQMAKAAGSTQFPKHVARAKTKACLVDTCGGCIDKGNKWQNKTRACLDLVQTFLEKSTSPFPMDKMKDHAAFFNIENPNSHVHSLACHDGNACIENVQLHSMLIKIVNDKYKPDSRNENVEYIFDPGSNPTPLLHILEQEMAMKASGNVTVFIEKDTDISSFEHLIKILMVYNKNVGFVNFNLTKDVKVDRIVNSIQRKIERWVQSSCPDRTRMLVAPYDVHIISESRRKRSIERSAERNQRIHNMRNWELNWLMTMT